VWKNERHVDKFDEFMSQNTLEYPHCNMQGRIAEALNHWSWPNEEHKVNQYIILGK